MMGVVLTLAGYESGETNWLIVVLGNILVTALEGLVVGIQVLRLENVCRNVRQALRKRADRLYHFFRKKKWEGKKHGGKNYFDGDPCDQHGGSLCGVSSGKEEGGEYERRR